jgi:hypothetical protein
MHMFNRDNKCYTRILDFKLSPCVKWNMFSFEEKETATEYNTVIPPAHALCTSPLLTTPNRLLTFPLPRPPTCLNPVRYKLPHTSQTQSYFIDLPLKLEPKQCSETSAISTQTPGKHPKENIFHLTHGESLKSIHMYFVFVCFVRIVHIIVFVRFVTL